MIKYNVLCSKWFTLVELIVVVTILAILSTVWFASYTSHLSWVRDTTRINQLSLIRENLDIYWRNKKFPIPDNYIEIKANGSVIWYQWYVWDSVLNDIKLQEWWKDPMDDTYYTYYLKKNKKSFQLLAFLEEEEILETNNKNLFSINTHANSIDYEDRYTKVIWDKLWVILEPWTNTPAQEVTSLISNWFLDVWTTTETHKLVYSNTESITLSWYVLYSMIASRSWNKAPDNCPEWFIWVPWNLEFHKEWFCVAQYEMTYSDATTPDTCNTVYPTACWAQASFPAYYEWNTARYRPWSKVVSMPWRYSIASISQWQAIEACKNLWKWYHLITSSERMTIARNIENNYKNWSSKEIWNWNLYIWVTWDTNLWCDATWWNTEARTYGTKTWKWTDESCNSKRKHELSNLKTIRDFAGNLWEYNDKSISLHWTHTAVAGVSSAWGRDDDGLYDTNDMKKYWSEFLYWMANGMWWVAAWWGMANNVIIRWNWASHNDRWWIYALYLGWLSIPTYRDTWIGFRCAK